ncbi:hypothetical protein Terro_0423 [Terriglobus roseus DSM 18391]|uniref:Uncharacterized protein n=1 Tax=Terriglobus roseus (strain DSM 18391 / NRRL B-41598 / KBS 63) TaxID=926566 RepID=I3ZC02_TERRK|nr:hypothetical protein [Terriglobus roseus]AFL86770.1 hypothetical protein Terro_0423 [Terriglobus roseus DSM 18391]
MEPRPIPAKIKFVQNTSDAILVTFEDGKEFIYPASILHSAIPKDDAVARQVKESLRRRTQQKASLIH